MTERLEWQRRSSRVLSPKEKVYLGLDEARDYSGLPRTYLEKLISEGKLSALKTGGGWRVRRRDLDEL